MFPSWFGKWREKEQVATTLRTYQPLVVPSLLQTEAYARVLLSGDESAAAARLDRQRILAREDPRPAALQAPHLTRLSVPICPWHSLKTLTDPNRELGHTSLLASAGK
ncbi:Scr1 family TA system antitoxin-like transcriptional regulator [Microbispora siamensis]